MEQLWAERNFGASDAGDGDAETIFGTGYRRAARLLVIAPDHHAAAELTPLTGDGAARLLGRVELADAAARIEVTARADAVWLFVADEATASRWEALSQALDARDCPLICEAPARRIDELYGYFSGLRQVVFLCDAAPVDRQIALATVTEERPHFVRDVAGDATQDRLDQLQEEVARISRLLGQLSLQGGDLAPPMFPLRADVPSGFSSSVRSPGRTYAAAPSGLSVERGLSPQRQRARQIRQMIRRRRMREQFFPADLFADPAWDMLLDLYAAGLEGQPVSVSSLCIAAAVPATTALRWIKTMTDAEIFERQADPRDGRRVFIALAAKTEAALARYFEALEDQHG